MMIFESKCGLICSKCSEREKFACAGCLNMPEAYWGEPCEIKTCCENKNREHCGQCRQFPCTLLIDISYDPDTGDDGERVMQCKSWADKAADERESFMRRILFGLCTGIIAGVIVGALTDAVAAWLAAGCILGLGFALIAHISNKK